MKKATFFTTPFYLNNRQFEISDPNINRDNCLYGFYALKELFGKYDIDLSTQDINHPEEAEFIIFNEMPPKKYFIHGKKGYLILLETEAILPKNWRLRDHQYFRKIFTWDGRYIDSKKYFKINFPNKIPEILDFNLKKKKNLCVMMAGNKSSRFRGELYSERLRAIRWFEKNNPEDFDLFGAGWDREFDINIFKFLYDASRGRHKFPSNKGRIPLKKPVMEQYKFAICYENFGNINDYITEKIFDCFFAGCVPVYLGAPNIADHIPPETFIDRRRFKNYSELYSHLKNMSLEDYQKYLNNILVFLKSDKIYPFSEKFFSIQIFRQIWNDING